MILWTDYASFSFKKVHTSVDPSPGKRLYGLRTFPAPLALADMYGNSKAWHPDVDDLDIAQEEVASVGAAATLLGVELPAPLGRQIKAVAKHCDVLELADDSVNIRAVEVEPGH